MKPTAMFINVGRGETTNTEQLVKALKQGDIEGAGLDVFEQEPLQEDHPLWRLDDVIIAAHYSGGTLHYHSRLMDIFIHNLRDYVEGRQPTINLVDLGNQY